MASFQHMKVATRLALGFGLTVALGVLIASIGTMQMRRLASSLDEIANDRMVKVDQFAAVKENLNGIARFSRNVLLSPDPAYREGEQKRIANARTETAKVLAALDKTLTLPRGREALKTINEAIGPYDQAVDHVIAMAVQGKGEEANKTLLGEVRDKQLVLFKAVESGGQLQNEVAKTLARDAMSTATGGAALLMGLALVMALVSGVIGWLITRNLTRALGAEPDEVSAAVNRVADGDLATPVGLRAGDVVSTMAAVKRMQESLASTVGTVRGNADSVATASAQIAQGNLDLSQRTETQASALQQTAATMEELGSTVRNNADNAKQANQLALGASTVALKGGDVVGQVVQTMKGINDSSRKIADIISVIDGIAFQTNILALNAAVEAARAGEQGRGFAVVASEVRSLAQRSAEAAKEIKTLITDSVEQVDRGTALVDQAGHTMEEIVGAIKRVTDIVGEISAASVEQSSGVSQVGEAVSQMDQATQQNAALVEESAAAAESLQQQAQQLVHAVSVFRIAQGEARPAAAHATRAAAPAVTVERRSPNRATNVTRPKFGNAPAASKPAAPAAAPKAEPQKTGTDEWESF